MRFNRKKALKVGIVLNHEGGYPPTPCIGNPRIWRLGGCDGTRRVFSPPLTYVAMQRQSEWRSPTLDPASALDVSIQE